MKFYTYRRSESARADCANSRDARTVNPDENKPYPRKAINGPTSVVFWNAARVILGVASYTGNNRGGVLHNMRDPLRQNCIARNENKKICK